MQKTKLSGILMLAASAFLMVLVLGYTAVFSFFGIKSGGSLLMITPLLLIALASIIGLVFLFRAGLKKLKQ